MLTRLKPAAALVLLALVVLSACNQKEEADDTPAGDGSGGSGTGGVAISGLGLSKSNTDHLRTSQENLHRIGIALHAHHDAMGRLPAGFYGPDGKTDRKSVV